MCLNTNGSKITNPNKCSKNIIVIGGKSYKYLRITPSKAQRKAAVIMSIGPANDLLFFTCIFVYLLGLQLVF